MNVQGSILFKTADGHYAQANDNEQIFSLFVTKGLIIVHVFNDEKCTQPLSDKPVMMLKSKLKLVGFINK